MNPVLSCLLALLATAYASVDVPEELQIGVKGNPGMQMCIRQRFLPTISDLFGQLIDKELPQVNPPDTSIKLQKNGVLNIGNMKIVSYSSQGQHSLALSPPGETQWVSTGLDFTVSGEFKSTLQQIISSSQTAGSIILSAQDATVVARIRIRAKEDGKQQLDMVGCKASFGNTSVSTQASGFFGALSTFFQKLVSQSSEKLLERITCNTAKYFIETVLNDMYANGVPTNVSMADSINTPSDSLPAELIFNYGLFKNPRVYNNCLSMQEIGEVSWENKGGTPFEPVRLNYSTKSIDDHMIDIWISDYTFNSLLYHANEHGVFDVEFNEAAAPQWNPNLQSQCSLDSALSANGRIDCIGIAVPELANVNDFPPQTVEMQVKSSTSAVSPYVVFQEQEHHVTLTAEFVIDLFLNDTKGQRKNALTAHIRIQSNIRSVKLDEVAGEIKFVAEAVKTNATAKITQDHLNLNPTLTSGRSNTLANFTASFMEKILNSKLAAGFTIPRFKGVKLIKPEAALFNRTMNVAANIEMDQTYWFNEASEARVRVQKGTK